MGSKKEEQAFTIHGSVFRDKPGSVFLTRLLHRSVSTRDVLSRLSYTVKRENILVEDARTESVYVRRRRSMIHDTTSNYSYCCLLLSVILLCWYL